MALAQRLRRLPLGLKLGIPAIALVLAGAGLALAMSSHHAPASRPAVAPSPSDQPSPSPSPSESPSPSSSTATSPSPVPTIAAPAPAATCGPAPAGGFPGAQLSASFPVALAWSADGRLFWAERSGNVKVYEGGAVRTFATVATSTSGERGLLGLAVTGPYVFAFYSNTDTVNQSVIRWTDCGGRATNPLIVVSGIPAGNDCCHKGGRIAVGPDGQHIFVTVGDNHVPQDAQNPASMRGKVTRFDLNGGGRTTWVFGLRNPFGIAFAPDGTLGLTNNGPSGDAGTPCGSCGDEFYLVGRAPGVDYQWPYCWGYSHPIGGADCHGLPGPQFSTEGGPYAQSSPYFVAPTGMTWSAHEYGGRFVFCADSNSHMYVYNGPRNVADTGVTGCALDVKEGPDGALYTSDPGAIHRH